MSNPDNKVDVQRLIDFFSCDIMPTRPMHNSARQKFHTNHIRYQKSDDFFQQRIDIGINNNTTTFSPLSYWYRYRYRYRYSAFYCKEEPKHSKALESALFDFLKSCDKDVKKELLLTEQLEESPLHMAIKCYDVHSVKKFTELITPEELFYRNSQGHSQGRALLDAAIKSADAAIKSEQACDAAKIADYLIDLMLKAAKTDRILRYKVNYWSLRFGGYKTNELEAFNFTDKFAAIYEVVLFESFSNLNNWKPRALFVMSSALLGSLIGAATKATFHHVWNSQFLSSFTWPTTLISAVSGILFMLISSYATKKCVLALTPPPSQN